MMVNNSNLVTLKKREFDLIRNLVYKILGIKLSDAKQCLVYNRLQKILKELKVNNFTDYYEYVISEPSGKALSQLIGKITTNHTYFYRENEHFDIVKTQVLPEIIKNSSKNNKPDIRLWSAGCATGEEAYTVSMTLDDFKNKNNEKFDYRILATDISKRAIEIAKNGEYPIERISELPKYYRKKYFSRNNNTTCIVNNNVKKSVLFKLLNLKRESFPFYGKFDIIFCRNVMIYFDEKSKNTLVEQLYKYTKKGGYLFVGHAESLSRNKCPYSYVKPSVYQKINE
jgi:chemotaxis protein methyltransferase CheR